MCISSNLAQVCHCILHNGVTILTECCVIAGFAVNKFTRPSASNSGGECSTNMLRMEMTVQQGESDPTLQ